jgi:CDP-4-dehydro-6-deoxyglucose reductase, E1
MNHSLMNNNITTSDRDVLIKFIKKTDYFTNGKKVKEFEKKWSEWVGTKYSVFVNSGSSANLLSISYIKSLYKDGEIIVSPLNWVSDITSILYNGFKPRFVDVNLETLSMDIDKIIKSINKKTRAILITHILGFNGLKKELLDICKKKKILLIEDVCESHGASFKEKKLGSWGNLSNFSFYYAHHLSTIEGGMVCTNDKKIYEKIRIMRGHGMLRESTDNNYKKKIAKKYSNLNEKFIFIEPGYNFRSTELNAVIGINQLKRLDYNNKLRNKNHEYFLKNLNKDKYFTDFNLEGSSNYAFVIIFRKKFQKISFRNKFENKLLKFGIEFRRGTSGGGNQLKQPYLAKFIKMKKKEINNFPNTDIIHSFGYYIGNYPNLSKSKILDICKILNSVNF